MWDVGGEKIKGCLIEKITQQSFVYLEAYYFYDAKGMFPNPGGWLEQPAKLLQVFRLIDGERGRIEEEERDDK
jgi:hypothetical protein